MFNLQVVNTSVHEEVRLLDYDSKLGQEICNKYNFEHVNSANIFQQMEKQFETNLETKKNTIYACLAIIHGTILGHKCADPLQKKKD